MVMSLVKSTVSNLKLAYDITKSVLELKPISEIQAKVVELQNIILSAQTSAFEANAHQTAMIEEIRHLKEEITRIKAWEEEKQRYKLVSPWPGTVLYALKEKCSASEPPHWVCAKCYEDGRKSILNPQKKITTKGQSYLVISCPTCKSELNAPHLYNPPVPEYANE